MSSRPYFSVAATLREMLAAGRWTAGERLPAERQLSDELEIPRATIREALIVLEVEGRVEVRQMSGVYALPNPISTDLILPTATMSFAVMHDVGPFELLRARQVVESAIAAAAALTVTAENLADMQRALEQEEADIDDGRGSYEGDATFHRLVAEATHNEALTTTTVGLWSMRRESPLWTRIHARIFDQTYRSKWKQDHRRILRALEQRNPEGARAAMWQHLENVAETLLDLSDPELSSTTMPARRSRTRRPK